MLAILFTLAVISPVALSGFVAGALKCGAPPWRRHFWQS